MVSFKVVFRDESNEKCIYGDVTFEDTLIKVLGDEGNLVLHQQELHRFHERDSGAEAMTDDRGEREKKSNRYGHGNIRR